jgi:hypothetical protein
VIGREAFLGNRAADRLRIVGLPARRQALPRRCLPLAVAGRTAIGHGDIERDLAGSERGEDRFGQIGKAKAALHMADRHAEAARHGFGIGAAIDDVAIGPRLIRRRHRLADQVFRKADLARGGILVLAEARIDRVILGQHAAFDQQADRAPAAATGVDIVEVFLPAEG